MKYENIGLTNLRKVAQLRQVVWLMNSQVVMLSTNKDATSSTSARTNKLYRLAYDSGCGF